MKRTLACFAAIGLFACATSTAPPNDGVLVGGGGVEAGDEGNPYGSMDDSGSDAGGPLADAGEMMQDAAPTDTGTSTDSGATDTGTTAAGVCAKTSFQQIEYGAAVLGGTGTDCSGSPSVCAPGECCYQTSLLSLCVTE